jgi:acetyl-CoA carboxylase carboxyl transferase subunit beta
MDTTSFLKKTIGGVTQIEPALTPPPANSEQTTFAKKPKIGAHKSKKREIPEGCGRNARPATTMIFDKELDENLKVCPKCQHHFTIGSRERIHSLVETCTFEEMDAEMTSVDQLKFATYKRQTRPRPQSHHAHGRRRHRHRQDRPHTVALGVMDFGFSAARWARWSVKS